jgi:hypothetical protein
LDAVSADAALLVVVSAALADDDELVAGAVWTASRWMLPWPFRRR